MATENRFHRDGEYWTLLYGDAVCRLKDAKGLRYLAALLSRPEQEVHVLDLAALTEARTSRPRGARRAPGAEELAADGLRVSGPGDTGPTLDARAREAYKRRVRDLEEELDEAEGFNDPERAARLHTEIEFLQGELAAAYGLAGRGRRRAGNEEQARKNVTNCIRSSLSRIERALPALGRHLMTAVKTGTFCSYGPERPTPWEL